MFDFNVVESRWLGMPVKFDFIHAFNNFWDPEEARIFPPTNFGFGWDVNFHAVAKTMGLIRAR